MTHDRRLEVLRAIVEDYVTTREPVGSRMLTQRRNLGVSSATIRSDMAALEKDGLITQPHTSAGRIPTDAGYRVFVDRLAKVRPLSHPQRRAIEAFLSRAVDVDDVVARAGRLLAQLTGQVAVVQYPTLRRSGLRHLEVVPTAPGRLLVIVICDNGRVDQRFVDIAAQADVHAQGAGDLLGQDGAGDLTDEDVSWMSQRLAAAAAGRTIDQLPAAFDTVVSLAPPSMAHTVRLIATAVHQALMQDVEDRVLLAGTANLARSDQHFERGLLPVLEALEEQVALLGLLTEMGEDTASQAQTWAAPADTHTAVAVRIGHENRLDGLTYTSVVSSTYGIPGAGEQVAMLGSIGPTHMDYSATIAAVRAVARYMSRVLPT